MQVKHGWEVCEHRIYIYFFRAAREHAKSRSRDMPSSFINALCIAPAREEERTTSSLHKLAITKVIIFFHFSDRADKIRLIKSGEEGRF